MNRLTARGGALAAVAGVALALAAALPAQAADSTVTESQWLADVAAVTGPAQTYIDSRAAANTSGAKQAIVLDIDNTSLETYFEGGITPPPPRRSSPSPRTHTPRASASSSSAPAATSSTWSPSPT